MSDLPPQVLTPALCTDESRDLPASGQPVLEVRERANLSPAYRPLGEPVSLLPKSPPSPRPPVAPSSSTSVVPTSTAASVRSPGSASDLPPQPEPCEGSLGSDVGLVAGFWGLPSSPRAPVLLRPNCHPKERTVSDKRTAEKGPGMDPVDPHTEPRPEAPVREATVQAPVRADDASCSAPRPAVALDLREQPSPCQWVVDVARAEHLARASVNSPSLDAARRILCLLPSEVPARGQAHSASHSWTCGMWTWGARAGVRGFTKRFPAVTRFFCALLRQHFPGHAFTNAAVFTNLRAEPHVDSCNVPGFPNLLLPISLFRDGDVWQESPVGRVPLAGHDALGIRLRVSLGPQTLDASRLHATLPWKGVRCLLVGYCLQGWERLSEKERQELLSLGFLNPGSLVQPAPVRPLTPPTPPLILELFSGSGRVTAALRALGFEAVAIDKVKSVGCAAPPWVLDVSTPDGLAQLLQLVQNPRVLGLFAAPACGTCSLARGIPCWDSQGNPVPVPRPLRSDRHADGMPDLPPGDARRVRLANESYLALRQAVRLGVQRGILIAVENPRSSLFWKTSFWRDVAPAFRYVDHQACAYGGDRPKFTRIAYTHPSFESLCKLCPGCPAHASWGVDPAAPNGFAASRETAYPRPLAHAIAQCFASALPTVEPPGLQLPALRSLAGLQPKASKVPALVPEYKTTCVVRGPAASLVPPCQPMQRLEQAWPVPADCQCSLKVIPPYAQLLRLSPVKMGKQDEETRRHVELAWGIPWSPSEFIQCACKAVHPVAQEAQLPSELLQAVEVNCNATTASALEGKRTAWFEKWFKRCLELRTDECKLKDGMHPDVRGILEPKNLLVWREILDDLNYPDKTVIEEVISGTVLTGEVPSTGLFNPVFKPAAMSEDLLRDTADEGRHSVFRSVKSQGDLLDQEVKKQTLEELQKGWLEGPFDPSELPNGSVVSRRFGIQQGSKVRLIDDLSASHVNSCVQTNESPKPHSTDVLAALAIQLMRSTNEPLLGRTHDLKAAYRQLAVSQSSAWCSYVCIWDHERAAPVCFRLKALPFGACRSVYSFLRVVHSIWFIGTVGLSLPWVCYFDDFITICSGSLAHSTDATIKRLFKLLGWTLSSDGKKDLPFRRSFEALGIVVDLEESANKVVKFANTPSRVSELCGSIGDILDAGSLKQPLALRLRGRMQFADSQLFGRSARMCLRQVTKHAYSDVSDTLCEDCVFALDRFRKMLLEHKPRVLNGSLREKFVIFTDACFDPEASDWACGIGGLLFSDRGKLLGAFSEQLERWQIEALTEGFRKTVIFEAELLAVIVSQLVWGHVIRHAPVLWFVDNNASRDIAISGCTRSDNAQALLNVLLESEEQFDVKAWYARVPSPSNPADHPSRTKLESYVHGNTLVGAVDVRQTLKAVFENFLRKKVKR